MTSQFIGDRRSNRLILITYFFLVQLHSLCVCPHSVLVNIISNPAKGIWFFLLFFLSLLYTCDSTRILIGWEACSSWDGSTLSSSFFTMRTVINFCQPSKGAIIPVKTFSRGISAQKVTRKWAFENILNKNNFSVSRKML